jgi:hypothetical protein
MNRATALAVLLTVHVLIGLGLGADKLAAAAQAGYRIGMSEAEALAVLRQAEQDPEAQFIDTICEIPLGLDVMGGMPFFTTDTGVRMKKAVSSPPLYFYKGRLIGMRTSLTRMDEFLALKGKHPNGRYLMHTYPDEKRATSVFVAEGGGTYAFTNRHSALYVFDDAARKTVAAGLQGSYCWHAKTVSPNLSTFPSAYRKCLSANKSQVQGKTGQDLASCKRYCSETHEFLASPRCASNCEQAIR